MRWLVLLLPCLAPAQFPAGLLGEWRAQVSGVTMTLRFEPGGRCSVDNDRGVCKLQDGWLTFRSDDGELERYAYDLAPGRLTLSGGDLDEPITFLPAQASPQTPHARRFHQPKWGLSFAPPPNWNAAERDGLLLLGSPTEPGLIVIRFQRRTGEPQLRAGYAAGLEEAGMKLVAAAPIQTTQAGASPALAGELAGASAEGPVTARVIAVLSPFGDAAVILAITTNANYARLKAHADALAATVMFSEPAKFAARDAIAGQYMYYYQGASGGAYSRQEVLNLCANGTFSRGGETHGSGSAGAAVISSANSGHWLADGDDHQGAITLIFRNGDRDELAYRKSGPDIVLNGKKYGRFGDGACSQRSP
ncbi:MAG: hypothetical protein K2X35_01095 [Bryobacteraceae bacterium]|nr:hypothetical protein [Bryobacteraceae bacterium]